MTAPRADRPSMPAGYLDQRPLDWAWAETRLCASANYWISTTCPDGRPHARPVWGAWIDDQLLFSNGSLILRNLQHDPRCTAHLESGDDVVIVEGTAAPIGDDPQLRRTFKTAYDPKYHWDMPEDDEGLWSIRPRVVFGWRVDPTGLDGGGLLAATATRWHFD